MRLFVAIQLPQEVQAHLRDVQNDLRTKIDSASWVKLDNFHLTLKFLGEVADERVPQVCHALKEFKGTGLITLMAARLSFLPPNGPARVVAAGLSGDVEMISVLAQRIDEACSAIGFQRERRKYRPHVTLARARAPIPSRRRPELTEAVCARFPGPEFGIEQFVLMQSTLRREGSEYTPVARFSS